MYGSRVREINKSKVKLSMPSPFSRLGKLGVSQFFRQSALCGSLPLLSTPLYFTLSVYIDLATHLATTWILKNLIGSKPGALS